MKLCLLSDLHGYLPPELPACDLILIAGDIVPTNLGNPNALMAQRQWLKDVFYPMPASETPTIAWCEIRSFMISRSRGHAMLVQYELERTDGTRRVCWMAPVSPRVTHVELKGEEGLWRIVKTYETPMTPDALRKPWRVGGLGA